MAKAQSVCVRSECGGEHDKWQGQCAAIGIDLTPNLAHVYLRQLAIRSREIAANGAVEHPSTRRGDAGGRRSACDEAPTKGKPSKTDDCAASGYRADCPKRGA